MNNFKPLSNKVLILPDASDSVTAGGILLAPKQTEDAIAKGTAVAVGPGSYTKENVLVPMQVAEGDKVLFDRRRAVEVELEGAKYFLTSETEILATL